MKHYRRLLALGALSMLLHLLLIAFVGRHWLAPARDAAVVPITLHLQPAPAAVSAPAPVAQPTPAPAPLPASAPAPAPAPLQPAPAPAPVPRLASSAPPVATAELDVPFQAPPRYRMRVPPPATLDYVFTHQDGTQSAVQIAWQTDGSAYHLAADGVMGQLASAGVIGDTGIEPKQSQLRRADGAGVAATFAAGDITIDGRVYPGSVGSQDPASLLVQLVGIGLAVPAQLRDVVAVYVASADGPLAMRFQVTEDEELATPLGPVMTRHLVQIVQPGQARLEIWLAPERRWLPVQLRLTAPDGAASTQTITRIAD